MIRRVWQVLLVLWAGSLWSLALWVTPILFFAQGDRHLAGLLAGRLFSIETYVGCAAAALALVLPGRMRFLPGYLAVALLAINEWALKRAMNLAHSRGTVAGLTFGAWHGVSAVLYVLACLLVLVAVERQPVGR